MGPLAAAAAGVGADLLNTGTNALFSGAANRREREWNEKMYDRQKQDNLDFWAKQNSYNSPQQQMQRLSDAGLNPALIYGNGSASTGNASSAPDAPSAMPIHPTAPRLNLGNPVQDYFNTQTQMQRLSNEKQMGNNLAADALIKVQDAKTKSMMNDYMGTYGYNNRQQREMTENNLNWERYLGQNAQNAFNFGGRGPDASGVGQIDKDSSYSLQAMGLKIMNDLRNSALQGNQIQNSTNRIKNKYTKRMMSGEFKDLGAKDIMSLVLQAVGVMR